MALRFMDSFDHYSTSDLLGTGNGQKWNYYTTNQPSSIFSIGVGNGRYINSFRINMGSGNGAMYKTLDNQSTWVVGFAFRTTNIASGNVPFIGLFDTGTNQVDLRLSASGQIQIACGGSIISGSTSTLALSNNTWYYIEFYCVISPSILANQCMVNVNGVNWINLPAGKSTRNTANSSANQISLGLWTGGFGGIMDYDDLYVLDGTGSAPYNTFLGDCRVESRLPQANSLTNVSWVPTAGNAFSCVNDFAPNGDQSFISSANTNDISTFSTLPISASPSSIFGLQITHSSRKTDAGIRQIADTLRSGSTNYPNSNPVSLSTSYNYYSSAYQNDPATSAAWTLSGINSAEIGIKEIT